VLNHFSKDITVAILKVKWQFEGGGGVVSVIMCVRKSKGLTQSNLKKV
jgi:hypothetical protein